MWNKVIKKYWIQLWWWFNLWTSTEIETDEKLNDVEKFIQNTGLNNFLQSFRKSNADKILTDTFSNIKWKDIKQIWTKESLFFLENASKEDDEYLQKKWTDLLSNSLTITWKINISYIEILKQLSSIEVKILDKIYEEARSSWWILTNIQFSSEKISQIFSISIDEVRVIVDNLYRLRLAEAPWVQWIQMWWFSPVWKTNDIFQITFLWIKFIEACKFN